MENTQQLSHGEQPGFATKRPAQLPNGILVALLGLQLAVVPWILATLIGWMSDDMLEDNVAAYFMLLPLVLQPFVVPLAVKLSRSPRFATFARNWLVYIGLAGQVFIDWLLYARFSGLFPFTPAAGAPSSGWTSWDNSPVVLFAAWLNWSGLVVVPALVCSLLGTSPGGKEIAPALNTGLAILACAMGMQWGGPWSMPFNHLVWIAVLAAVLAAVQDRRPVCEPPAERKYFPVFSTAGLGFLVAFWLSTVTVGTRGSPNQPWPWLTCAAASTVLAVVLARRPGLLDSGRFQSCIVVAWVTCCAATLISILVNLVAWFAVLLVVWQAIGLAALSSAPALLHRTALTGTTRTGGRLFFAGSMAVAGIITAYLLNLYDPVSSYAAFIVLGLPITMTFTALPRRGARDGGSPGRL